MYNKIFITLDFSDIRNNQGVDYCSVSVISLRGTLTSTLIILDITNHSK